MSRKAVTDPGLLNGIVRSLADAALYSFKKTPNAAIYLNNVIHVRDKSAGGCAKLCLSKSWCRSCPSSLGSSGRGERTAGTNWTRMRQRPL